MHPSPTPVQVRIRRSFLIGGLLLTAQLGSAQAYIPAPQFGTNGLVNTNVSAGVIQAKQHLTPEGWLIIGTTCTAQGGGGSNSIQLLKMDAYCGAPDTTFGTDGLQNINLGYQTHLNDMAVLEDGRIAVAGMNAIGNGLSEIKPIIFLFRADGSLDTSFNHTGYNKMLLWPPSADIAEFFAVIPTDDGKLYAIGATGYDPGYSAAGAGVMRFNLDGTLDTSYSADGITWVSGPSGGIDWGRGDAVLHADGKLTVAGFSGGAIALIRFNADGIADTDFGTNGSLVTTMEANMYSANVMMLEQADGKLLVSTRSSADGMSQMGRFTADGQFDPTFGTDGISFIFVQGAGGVASRGIVFDTEGNTLQSATWENSGNLTHYIVKRDINGAPFAGFGTNGVFTIPDSPNMSLYNITMPDEDHLLLSGGYGGYINAIRLTTSLDAEKLVVLGPDTSACPGSELVITPLRSLGVSLGWTGGSTDPTLTVSTSGSYVATAYTIGGCTQSDTIVVTIAGPATPVVSYVDNELSSSLTGDLQWFLDGDAIAGATQATYVPTENGQYTVVLTDANGCTATSDPVLVLNVGINALTNAATNLQLFPNPVNDQPTLSFFLNEASPVTLELRDALGRLVSTLRNGQTMPQGSQRLVLSIPQDLAQGNYLLVLMTPMGRVSMRVAK